MKNDRLIFKIKCSLAISFFFILTPTVAQKKDTCQTIMVSVLSGTVNGIAPADSQEKIKNVLPCFSGSAPEGGAFNCGGGIFYIRKDVYFYTHKDYIEIRTNYTDSMDVKLMGMTQDEVKEVLKKKPVYMSKDKEWSSSTSDRKIKFNDDEADKPKSNYFSEYYKMEWGTLLIRYGKISKKVEKFSMHQSSFESVELCGE